jgi:hypothetical protein
VLVGATPDTTLTECLHVSRGLGDVQRLLLAIFDKRDGPVDTFDLAELVYDEPGRLTEAQLSAVQRALIWLADKGALCRIIGGRGGWQRWARPQTLVRMHRKGHPIDENIRHGRAAYRKAKRAR